MKILCVSDVHSRTRNIEKLADLDFDVLVISGDLTNFGGYEEAVLIVERFKRVLSDRRMLAVPGNCDYPEVDKALSKFKINLNESSVIIDNVGFFGVGGSNITPFNTPFEFSEDILYEKALRAYENVKDAEIKIFVSHTPPYKTKVDKTSSGINVGSKMIRKFIEENDIDVVVCGHIHEAKGHDRIKETLIINPGAFSHGFCMLEILGKNRISYRFVDL